MHSQDRTLIASLGFSDPDKQEQMHSLACEFLSQPIQAERLVRFVEPKAATERSKDAVLVERNPGVWGHDWETPYPSRESAMDAISQYCEKSQLNNSALDRHTKEQFTLHDTKLVSDGMVTSSRVEVVISKGDGKYMTTVGFLDVKIEWKRETKYERRATGVINGSLIVEVKIAPIDIADAIRQLKFYRQYVHADRWVLATAFDIHVGQSDTLKKEGIHHIRLGAGFSNWFEERAKREAPKMEQF